MYVCMLVFLAVLSQIGNQIDNGYIYIYILYIYITGDIISMTHRICVLVVVYALIVSCINEVKLTLMYTVMLMNSKACG